MAAVHTPYNLVGLQINGSRIYLPSERYLEDLTSHCIPLIHSLSGEFNTKGSQRCLMRGPCLVTASPGEGGLKPNVILGASG